MPQFPRSVVIPEVELQNLISDILKANNLLKKQANKLELTPITLRDDIFAGRNLYQNEIMQSNKKNVHILLSTLYDLLHCKANEFKVCNDIDEVYILGYDILWMYTDSRFNVSTYFSNSLVNQILRFKEENSYIIKSSALASLMKNIKIKKVELANNFGHHATLDDIFDSLQLSECLIRKALVAPTKKVHMVDLPEKLDEFYDVDEIKNKLVDRLTPIEYDALMVDIYTQSKSDLAKKYKCSLKSIYLNLNKAKEKLKFFAAKEVA